MNTPDRETLAVGATEDGTVVFYDFPDRGVRPIVIDGLAMFTKMPMPSRWARLLLGNVQCGKTRATEQQPAEAEEP